jgi:DNA-binding CsgD family transcriptional regulator
MKLYKTLTVPAVVYCSEIWTIKARDARRITAAEMKCMRTTAGYTWTDHKTNTEIAKELNITTVLDKIQEYRINRLQHVNRTSCNRLLRIIKELQTKRQMEAGEIITETSGSVRPERVDKWRSCVLA